MRTVSEKEEVVCVSSNGMIVRTPVSEISVIGRNTQGVRVIRLKEDDSFVAVAVVMPEEKEEILGEEAETAQAVSEEETPTDSGETRDDEPDVSEHS